MHFVEAKGILSAANGMNIYRGCSHGCIYCDSRSACYQMDHDFQDVAVKVNGLSLLEEALRRKRRPTMVGFGFMSDLWSGSCGKPGGRWSFWLHMALALRCRPSRTS